MEIVEVRNGQPDVAVTSGHRRVGMSVGVVRSIRQVQRESEGPKHLQAFHLAETQSRFQVHLS